MTPLVPATAGALVVAGLIGLTLGLRRTPPPASGPAPIARCHGSAGWAL